MNEEKMSLAEIAKLRETAQTERATRKKIQKEIALVFDKKGLSSGRQMAILRRGRSTEIIPLMNAYTRANIANYTLSDEAQMYIYDKQGLSPFWENVYKRLITDFPLCEKLQRQLVKDRKYRCEQRLSPDVEIFLLSCALQEKDCDRINAYSYFNVVERYLTRYILSEKAEIYFLQECLNIKGGRDSYMDLCENLVHTYLKREHQLSLKAEKILLAHGNHLQIMTYIQNAPNGLKSEEELLARGNRKEITAYFERYVEL